MIITSLKLNNFRNYKKLNIKFDKRINIFIGNNAQGKTNVLESIYVLAITKSHKTGLENNLIKIGENSSKIEGSIKDNKIINDLKVVISEDNKKVFLNSNEVKRIASYIGIMNVIMFCPDDLDLLKKSPLIRRNYLNIEISQLDNLYIKYLNEYNKLLKNRNEYLKKCNNNIDRDFLDTLDIQLVDRAKFIYKCRLEFINSINIIIDDIYYKITKLKGLNIRYDYGFEEDFIDENEYGEYLLNKLKNNRKRELLQGMTLYGPHRDDYSFYLENNDLKYFGSQGQQRIAIIAFKLSEIEIFKSKTGKNPILLLDDIFSEIDIKKKNQLLSYINGDIQTIITTTDLKNINKRVINDAKIFEVDNGNIVERVK